METQQPSALPATRRRFVVRNPSVRARERVLRHSISPEASEPATQSPGVTILVFAMQFYPAERSIWCVDACPLPTFRIALVA